MNDSDRKRAIKGTLGRGARALRKRLPLTLVALTALIVAASVGARQYLSKDAQAGFRTATVRSGTSRRW